MSQITLGQLDDGGGALRIDIPTLVESRALITGNSGAGKSRLLRRLIEQAFGKVQILVLDPEGEFASLREKHAFLLAGRGGEMPAEPRAAALMARRLMELRASAVLDLYDLKIAEQRAFVRLFCEAIMETQRDAYRHVLVVVDEAQRFCPEKGHGEAESTENVVTLMAQGRKRGLCGILATLRLSMLNKDAAAQASNNFIGMTTLDVDQKRAAAVLGITSKTEQLALRDIPRGTFLAYGPALETHGVVRFKSGDVHTTHPQAGKRQALAPPAPAEVEKFVAELQDLPAKAEEELRTQQALKARVRELEREARAHRCPTVAPAPKPRDVAILKDAQVKRLERAIDRAYACSALLQKRHAEQIDALSQRLQVFVSEAGVLAQQIKMASGVTATPPAPASSVAVYKHQPGTPPNRLVRVQNLHPEPGKIVPRAPRQVAAVDGIGKGETVVLVAIAQHGDDGVTREQLTVLTGYKRSTRDAYLQRLRAVGHTADGRYGTIVATAQGIAALGPSYEPLPTGPELRAYWLQRLPDGERKILAECAGVYPGSLLRTQLDDLTGYKRSSRDAYVQRLAARRLVVADRGGVRMSDALA